MNLSLSCDQRLTHSCPVCDELLDNPVSKSRAWEVLFNGKGDLMDLLSKGICPRCYSDVDPTNEAFQNRLAKWLMEKLKKELAQLP